MCVECDNQVSVVGKGSTFTAVSLYFLEILPYCQATVLPSGNARQLIRAEYALTQRNFSRNSGRCIKEILEGESPFIMPSTDVMATTWKTVTAYGALWDFLEYLRGQYAGFKTVCVGDG